MIGARPRRRGLGADLALVSPALVSLALASLTLASPARAQELFDYTVRPGDSCRAIAARVLGDADAYPQIHAHNPELGPMPHRLAPGTVLRLPRPSPPARIVSVQRRVDRRTPDAATFADARAGQALPRGTQVRTHDAASAEIAFEDRSLVQVRQRTLVIIYGGQRRLASRPVTRAELESGALRSRLGELAGRRPLEVETPSSRASLDGDAVVSVGEDGTSRVANHGRRAATVEAGGRTITLPAGTGTVVRRGEQPAQPRRLLAAPRWRAESSGPVIGFVGRGATLRGGFDAVRGADRYRVEVSSEPDGAELLTTLELGGRASAFEASGLPEGTVYVSIASIDRHGLEGRRSPWRAFTVRLARLVEPGGAAAEPDGVAPRVWPGTWLVAPRGLDCADGDGPMSGIVTLRGRGRHEVRCQDRRGAETRLPVEVIEVAVRADLGALVRDRRTELRIDLAAPRVPPASVLRVSAPAGFQVERPRVSGPDLVVDVWASPDAPPQAELTVSVAAGSELVPLGSLVVPVRDPDGSHPPDDAPAPDDAPTPGPVHEGLGAALWPSALGLRDERRGGFGAWIYGILAEAPGDEPQLRLGVAARAQLPGVPLRVMFAGQLDALARPAPVGRRGDADLYGELGLRLLDEGAWGAAVDLGAWIPTRGEPDSLGRVRLTPSVAASWRPFTLLAVRTRQGAIVDATDTGARLWAWALGVDLVPLEWLAIGAELDGSIGRFAEGDGAALAVGGGVEGRWGLFEAALSARAALTDEARVTQGEWSFALTLRLWAQ